LARRVKHLDSQNPSSPDGIDAYVYYFYNRGWQVLETRDTTTESDQPESLQPVYQYVWSPRYIDAPILRDENTDADGLCDDERIYYLGDANFNVTTLVDTGGDAVERYIYNPYGVLTVYDATWANIRSDSSYDIEYTYTDRRLDLETGLYYCRHRVYHSQLGRFASRDPLEVDDSPYRYVGNSPTNATDPSGLWRFVPGMGTLSGSFGPGDESTYGKACSDFQLQFDRDRKAFPANANNTCCAEIRFVQIFYMDVRAITTQLPNRKWTFDPYKGTPPYYPDGTFHNPSNPIVTDSTMYDSPYFARLWKYFRPSGLAMDFETCAVCSKSKAADGKTGVGDVFACVRWGRSFQIAGPVWNVRVRTWKRYVENDIWTNTVIVVGGKNNPTHQFKGIANPPSNNMKPFLNKYFP